MSANQNSNSTNLQEALCHDVIILCWYLGKTWLCCLTWCGKRILSLHCTLYVHLCMHMLYAGDHVSPCSVLVIWVCMIWNNLGSARVCPGLQVPMVVIWYLYFKDTKHLKQWLTNHIEALKTEFAKSKSGESMAHKLTRPWAGAYECHEAVHKLLPWHNFDERPKFSSSKYIHIQV